MKFRCFLAQLAAIALLSIAAGIDRVFGIAMPFGLGADISLTAGNVLASIRADFERRFAYGAAATTGQHVYLDDSETWQLYDSNGTAGHERWRKHGIAYPGGAAGQIATVVTEDPEFTPGGTLTPGGTVYGSATPGGVTHDVPSSGQVNVVLGPAYSAAKMVLKPTVGGTV